MKYQVFIEGLHRPDVRVLFDVADWPAGNKTLLAAIPRHFNGNPNEEHLRLFSVNLFSDEGIFLQSVWYDQPPLFAWVSKRGMEYYEVDFQDLIPHGTTDKYFVAAMELGDR